MQNINHLDERSFSYIEGFGLDPKGIIPVTNWLDIVTNPNNLVCLFDILRGILKNPKRIAFLIRYDNLAAIFANIPEGYIGTYTEVTPSLAE